MVAGAPSLQGAAIRPAAATSQLTQEKSVAAVSIEMHPPLTAAAVAAIPARAPGTPVVRETRSS